MHVREMREEPVAELDKYIILDTHGGHEDVIGLVAALRLATKNDRIVLGITCVGGRRKMDSCVRDALIAQQIAETSFPVFKGATKGIMLEEEYPRCINLGTYFKDLDSFTLDEKMNSLVQKQSAASFISKSKQQYKQQLCIITFGPVTNIAMAFHLSQCAQQHENLSSLRINGGSYTAVGNVVGVPNSQGNFYFDPEAAHIVVTNYSNIYINPIERTLETSFKQEINDLLQSLKNSRNNKGIVMLLNWLKSQEYSLCGPLLTILPVFNRLIADKTMNVYSQVIRSGYQSNGLMIPNWLRLEVKEGQQTPNTKIYSDINRKILSKLLQQAFD